MRKTNFNYPEIESIPKYSRKKFLKNNYPEFLEWLEQQYLFTNNLSEKLYLFYNGLDSHHLCPTCGKPTKFIGLSKGYQEHCDSICASNDPSVKSKREQTCFNHYGVKCSFQSEEIKEKSISTCTKKYGTKNFAQTKQFRNRFKDNEIEEIPLKLEDIEIPDIDNLTGMQLSNKSMKCHYPDFYKYVSEKYSFLDEVRSKSKPRDIWKEKLYLFYHNMEEPKLCIWCGKNYAHFKGFNKGYSDFCSIKCSTAGTREKAKQTTFERYGVYYYAELPECTAKIKQTKKERHGNENYNNTEKNIETCLKRHGVTNGAQTPRAKEKFKKTCFERFGVDNYTKTEEYKIKTIQTNNRKFGADYFSQTELWNEKIKEGFNEKFGVDYYFQTEEFKERAQQSHMKNLGVPWPTMSPMIQEKIKEGFNEKFGVDFYTQTEECKEKTKQTNNERYGVPYPFATPEALEKSRHTLSQNTPNKLEQKLIDFLNELGIEHEFGTWDYITNSNGSLIQIDVFIKKLNLAIEINGSYFHSIRHKGTTKTQHIEKFLSCKEKNIELVYLWEDWIDNEWENVKDFLISKIKHNDVSKFKSLWFPDLKENEWPNDLGWKTNVPPDNEIYMHRCLHGKFECFDSGYVLTNLNL